MPVAGTRRVGRAGLALVLAATPLALGGCSAEPPPFGVYVDELDRVVVVSKLCPESGARSYLGLVEIGLAGPDGQIEVEHVNAEPAWKAMLSVASEASREVVVAEAVRGYEVFGVVPPRDRYWLIAGLSDGNGTNALGGGGHSFRPRDLEPGRLLDLDDNAVWAVDDWVGSAGPACG